jgi:hypothetical protein
VLAFVNLSAAVKVEKATCSAPGQKQVSGRKML